MKAKGNRRKTESKALKGDGKISWQELVVSVLTALTTSGYQSLFNPFISTFPVPFLLHGYPNAFSFLVASLIIS
jgi:hypothetical protein